MTHNHSHAIYIVITFISRILTIEPLTRGNARRNQSGNSYTDCF